MLDTRIRSLLAVALYALALAACGQRGPLYLPDRNARVVTRPAVPDSAPATASAPSSAPQ